MIYIPVQSPPSLFLSLKLIECYQCDDTSNTAARQFGNIISLLFVTTISDTTREINIIQEGMRLTLLVFPRKNSIITNIFFVQQATLDNCEYSSFSSHSSGYGSVNNGGECVCQIVRVLKQVCLIK